MTMKLPIILSAMIAALAVSGTMASQEGTEPTKEDVAAPESHEADAPAAKEEKKEAKKGKMGKKHHKRHKHHGTKGGEVRGMAPTDPNDRLPYDERVNNGSGCGGSDSSHHAGEMEVPGQKTP